MMKNNKDIRIIPSPLPTVTEYETQFAQDGMDYIAGAITEVLNYIKKENRNGAVKRTTK